MHPVIIGIAGGSGSGKTTLANAINARLSERAAELAFDRYYRDHGHLPPDERAKVNYDHPDALDVPLFVSHLHAVRLGQPVEAPCYDFATHQREARTELVEPAPVVLVDGILLLCDPGVRAALDIAVFITAPDDVRLERRVVRDVAERGRTAASVRDQFAATVKPMHDAHVGPSAAFADLVVDGRAPVAEAAASVIRLLPADIDVRETASPR